MSVLLSLSKHIPEHKSLVLLCNSIDDLNAFSLSKDEKKYVQEAVKKEQKSITLNRFAYHLFVVLASDELEKTRLSANALHPILCQEKITKITLVDYCKNKSQILAFAESLALSNYQFLNYFSDKKSHSLKEVALHFEGSEKEVQQLQSVIDGTCVARDLVNEPLSYLTAPQYSKDIEKLGQEAGFKVEVFHKKKIEALKMGGLLAVNKGSIDPPTFNIME